MRYPASEKLEIIRLVERSHLPVRRTLDKLGIPATTFYRWYDRYRAFGEAGLEDRTSGPGRIWNRIPDDVRRRIVDLALDEPELSPRELAVTFTDTKGYFVSEASVYRLLKAHDLITSPAFVVIKAADEFRDKTAAPNQLWQTDFTYLKVIGWGWFYLSTILDDFSRYIIAWKLCTTMRAEDVTDTLKLALEASGCSSAEVVHKPRLLSDNGSSYIAGDLAAWLEDQGMDHVRGAPNHPQTQGKIERWHQTLKNGERDGITYGQWKGGPAGSLNIEFDWRFARNADRAARVRMERAGKTWSYQVRVRRHEARICPGRQPDGQEVSHPPRLHRAPGRAPRVGARARARSA